MNGLNHTRPDDLAGKGCGARAGELTSALLNRYRDLRDRCMILFLMDTRLRYEELVRLDLASIKYVAHEHPDGRVETIGRGFVIVPNSKVHKEFVLSSRTVEALNLYWAALRSMDVDSISLANRSWCRLRPKMIWFVLREWYDRALRLRGMRGLATRFLGVGRTDNRSTRSTCDTEE